MDPPTLTTALSKLPDEVLLQIFQYLPTNDIIGNILDVCERWREVVINYIPWNAKVNGNLKEDWGVDHYGQFDFECSVKILRKAATAGVKIDTLHLANCGQDLSSEYSHIRKCETLSDSALEIICSNSLQIQTLILESVTINEKIGLFNVLDSCPLLNSLKVGHRTCIHTVKSENYDNSKHPKYLNIMNLSLSGPDDSADEQNKWTSQLIRRCSSLCNCEMMYLPVTSQLVQALSELKQLETIKFHLIATKDKTILRPLENNSTVTKFYLSWLYNFSRCEEIDLSSISTMTGLKQLKIYLQTGSEMVQFLATLPFSIENISLEVSSIEMKDEHLLLLSKRLGPHLKSVKINAIDQDFTDSGLRVFINNMKELELLKLNFEIEGEESMLLEGNSWITAIRNHPTLKRVTLNIRDENMALPYNYFSLIDKSSPMWEFNSPQDDDESRDYRDKYIEINWQRDSYQ